MKEEQVSLQELWASPLSSRRRRASVRFWIGVLLIALCLSGVGTVARADPGCFDRCQAALASCLAAAHGDPGAEFQCQGAYDDCGEQCMLQ